MRGGLLFVLPSIINEVTDFVLRVNLLLICWSNYFARMTRCVFQVACLTYDSLVSRIIVTHLFHNRCPNGRCILTEISRARQQVTDAPYRKVFIGIKTT